MATTASTFACGACDRKFLWSEQLAGKKVRCKCGEAIRVPGGAQAGATATPASSPRLSPPSSREAVGFEADDLYALVADAETAARRQTGTIRSLTPAPVLPLDIPRPPRFAGPGSSLNYQRGPTQRDRGRAEADTLLDLTRDVYVPLGMLAVGMLLYVGYFASRYNVGAVGLVGVSFGACVVAAIQAAILFAFALLLSGALDVGFGNIWTAFLKFGGIVLLWDGLSIWLQLAISKTTGGLGASLLSWPAGLALYWGAFTYLFSLDVGEALAVVAVIRVLDFILSLFLITVLTALFFGALLGSAGRSAFPMPTFGSSSRALSSTPDRLADRVTALQGTNLLVDGLPYAQKNDAYMTAVVANLLQHGAKHVWYEVVRDINLHATPVRAIVELPDGNAARSRCLRDMKAFYDTNPQIFYNPSHLVDKGRPYVVLQM